MKAISSLGLLALLSVTWAQVAPPPQVSAGDGKDSVVAETRPDSAVSTAPAAPEEAEEEEDEGAKPPQASLAFLIPAEGDVIYAEDVRIVAYVQGPSPSAMLAVLDGYSLDRPLRLEEGMLTVELPGMRPGVHEIKVVFLDERQQIQMSRTVRFFVRVPEPHHKPAKGALRQFGRALAQMDWKGAEAKGQVMRQSELKIQRMPGAPAYDSLVRKSGQSPLSQNIDGATEVSYTVKYDRFESFLKGLLRADDPLFSQSFRQPSNRFSGRIAYGPWLTVRGGDLYPVYNNLILNGTRVRGGEVNVAAVTDDGEKHWLYAKAVTGETKIEIPAYVAEYDTGNGKRMDTVSRSPGQNLTAIRLGAGGGEHFDLGFTIMKASETSGDSIDRVLNDSLHGVRPIENLATGLDLRVGLWDGRIQAFGTWASSLYTRDRSLGADTSKGMDQFENLFVANLTTRGWQYLAGNKDIPGFIDVNSAYEAGLTTSLPFSGMVAETEFRYSHLGLEYHSEGNPFLGTNPGDGWNLQQRLVVLDNRLFLGVEVENFVEELGFYKQDERALKGEIRFLPGAYRPAFWVNGGLTSRAPRGNYPYQFNQEFAQINVGGFHQINLGPGKLHGSVLYGFTRGELDLKSNLPPDTANGTDTLLSFPVSLTHIVNTSMQYKFRGSDFAPKLSYTFASNGVQEPTHNLALGFQNTYFSQQMRVDCDLIVGQYPKTVRENDLSLGENLTVVLRLGGDQSVRLREKWVQYGDRASIIAGAYYEVFF